MQNSLESTVPIMLDHGISPYQLLANAVLAQMFADYEILLSDDLGRKQALPSTVTVAEIKKAAVDCEDYSDLNLPKILDKIELIYKTEWRPYVYVNAETIMKDWAKLKKARVKKQAKINRMKKLHPCPLCGGAIRPDPDNLFFECSGCDLNMRIPKGARDEG